MTTALQKMARHQEEARHFIVSNLWHYTISESKMTSRGLILSAGVSSPTKTGQVCSWLISNCRHYSSNGNHQL
jgi:hypothetical protein